MRESGENYLETIYILSQRKSGVHASDIAEELQFSKPSVTRATGILKQGGYIEIDRYKHIQLTEKGLIKAQAIYQRHKTITRFWVLNGVSPKAAAEDACRMEHDISEETFLCIKQFVEKNDNGHPID